jgi:hypothetical protein
VSRDLVPEFDETHQFAGLVGAGQIGVGVAQDPALLLLSEEAEHTGTGLALPGDIVRVQSRGIAPKGDGMEVQGEVIPVGEEPGCQCGDPAREEPLLMITLGAIGVFGSERRLGQDVQAGEETEWLITVEITDVTPSLLIQQLQGEQAQQRAGGGDHV